MLSHLPPIVPDYQPIPFPAPLWLLEILIVVGFFLHVIPMNMMIGSCAMAAINWAKAAKSTTGYELRLAQILGKGLPVYVSFAITQGIVPLLFLQLIYGPLYYTSSMLMAWPWISIIVLLLLAYYLTYVFKFKAVALGPVAPVVLWIALGVMLLIGFFFTNNMTLMLHPERWPDMIAMDRGGWLLNANDPQVLPRFLHMIFGAFAVTGLIIGIYGLYWRHRDPAFSQWLIQKGSAVYWGVTVVQIAVGGWFLMKLPKTAMHQFMGEHSLATGLLAVSLILTLVSIIATLLSWRDGNSRLFSIGAASGFVVVLLMVVMRHLLRVFMTQTFLHPQAVELKVQWDLLIVFVISAVLLIAYLTWLVSTIWRAYHQPVELN